MQRHQADLGFVAKRSDSAFVKLSLLRSDHEALGLQIVSDSDSLKQRDLWG